MSDGLPCPTIAPPHRHFDRNPQPATCETSMFRSLMPTLLRWRASLIPESLGLGWAPIFGLGYLMFLFMPPLLVWLGDTRSSWVAPLDRLLPPTLLSIALFLPLYFAAYRSSGERLILCMLAIAGLGYALLPFNPFANTYTIYAIGFAATVGRSLWPRLGWALLILGLFLLETFSLDYPLFVFLITLLVSIAVFFGNHHFIESTRKRAELKLSHDEVRRLASLAERERIGRDLHDLLGHTLSLIALKSDLAAKLVARDPQAAAEEIAEVSRVAREALTEVRSAVTGIRAAGIAAELVSARLLLESDGIALTQAIAPGTLDAGALPPTVENALALTLREAVTNLQRHAKARTARLELALEWGEAVLRVSDDGRGGRIVPGNGLAGMRERVEALGGRLRVDARRGEGVVIEARVPLPAARDALESRA
jgi:two-component system sensor histidine kinase DesK